MRITGTEEFGNSFLACLIQRRFHLLIMRYRIDMKYWGGWGDAGWTEEKGGNDNPVRFETVSEAQVALDQFFVGVERAVAAGHMDFEAARNDYRIAAATD